MQNAEAVRGMQRAGFKQYQTPEKQSGPPASASSPGESGNQQLS
jgi:hypothetical protein